MRRYRLCVMAIRIGPDQSLASKVKPSGAQPTAAPAIGGRSPASRHAEERRAREASAARRDAEDRARDSVAKAADDEEDLGDFGDVDADESDGREYGMDDQLNYDDLDDQGLAPGDAEQAPARPSRPGREARPSTPPPAESADPLDEGELTDSDLGLDDADHQGRSAPTTRTLKTDDLLDLSRRAMNDADTIAERDWLSHVADQGERGELRANAYIGPSHFTGEQDYRIGSLDADACEAEFGKWDTARQEKERADWMATQPEPRFAAERDWMMGQLGEQDYHKAFDPWAAQQQTPADADAPNGETAPAGDVTEYDLLASGAGGVDDDLLAQETKAARFEAEAPYLAGRTTSRLRKKGVSWRCEGCWHDRHVAE